MSKRESDKASYMLHSTEREVGDMDLKHPLDQNEAADFPNHKHYNSVLQEKERQEGRLEGFTVYELAYRPDKTRK